MQETRISTRCRSEAPPRLLDLGKEFVAKGATFERQIMNYATFWQLQPVSKKRGLALVLSIASLRTGLAKITFWARIK